MKTNIRGQNYDFCVMAGGGKFYIEATHRVSFRFSFINNLNAILSEFNVSENDERISESQWVVSKKQGALFFKQAKDLLENKDNRGYIEKKLDEDRSCGEWENIKIFKNKK